MAQERIGRYTILEDIASGTQGAVHRAFDPESGQIVAVKVLHPSLAGDRSYLERFHREATITSSIDHPNVVRIYEVGESDGRHFIAMEFLPESLARLIESAGRLPIPSAVSFAVQIADGLAAAHAKGIVHRDIKPQNVLIAADGVAKVTDFGIARGESLATMTATGMMMGTPYYMSPEQCLGERADARSDIYSLGCVLYQMLTGALPFEASTPLAVLRKHTDEPPRPIREVRDDIPQPVADIVARALEKEPEERFGTAIEMAGALRRVASDAAGLRAAPEPPTAPAREPRSRRGYPPPASEPPEREPPPPRAPEPAPARGSRAPWILLAAVVVAAIVISVSFATGNSGKTVEVPVIETVIVEVPVELEKRVVETVVVEVPVPGEKVTIVETVVVEVPVEVEKKVVETVIVERIVGATPTPVPGSAALEQVVFTYIGTGQGNSLPFEVGSSPWKLRFSASWTGSFALYVREQTGGGSYAVVNRSVTSGAVYETYVYDWEGAMYFAAATAPSDGQWTVWVLE